jgi:prolyl-tRNA synthetase
VPIRLEVGPKDLEKNQALAVIRFNGEKRPIELIALSEQLIDLLEEIHNGMYKK